MLSLPKLLVACSVSVGCAFAYSGDIATLELRLQTPLNSYKTPVGSAFRSVLIAPCTIGTRVLLLPGTVVYGVVRRRTQVGTGLVHERAGLDLDFTRFELPDGQSYPMQGRLRAIENARETVNQRGHIEGVLAADNPQHWLDGIWKRPSVILVQHSLLGLTGMSGRVFAAFEMGPLGAIGLIVFRIALFSLPEPEIRLPAGIEMKVALTGLPLGAPREEASPKDTFTDLDALDWAGAQPFLITKPNGRASEDLVNMAFAGTQDQLLQAFDAAGWTVAIARSLRSFSHLWHSYATQTGYADAPASILWYRDAEPDFVFEKSFNTIAMRHHIRVWHSRFAGRDIWLGAATHDISIGFDRSSMAFTHRIDPAIDQERAKLVNDLTYAGCNAGTGFVPRPSAVRFGAKPNEVSTDGAIAVVFLQDCVAPESVPDPDLLKPARSVYIRLARRVILETRQYLERENPYYWCYRLWAWRWEGRKSSEASAVSSREWQPERGTRPIVPIATPVAEVSSPETAVRSVAHLAARCREDEPARTQPVGR